MRTARTALSALVTLVLISSASSSAHAFCREVVGAKAGGACVETPGAPLLHWTRSCTSYVFNDQMFTRMPSMSEDEIRNGFKASFQQWADVGCNGNAPDDPFFVDQESGVTDTTRSEFKYDERNESIMVARTADEWAALQHDSNALALTLLWHNKKTGEILDVDMEFNTGAGNFANCDRPCTRGMIDLRNTVTHEAGHYLGLGHSTVVGSTMEADAPDGQISKRSLEADDKAGYCSLTLPQHACNGECSCGDPPIYSSTKTVTTCGCRIAGAAQTQHGAWLYLLLGLPFMLRSWRRRRLRN